MEVRHELIARRETDEGTHRVPTTTPTPTTAERDSRSAALSAAVGVVGGAALMVLGGVAMARSDLDGSMNLPVIEVAGWPHSPLLGILEIAAGAGLLIVSLSSVGEPLVSALIAGFGVIALIEPRVLDDRLNIDPTHAWLLVGLGGVGLLAALVSYVMSRSPSERVAELEDAVGWR